MGQQGSSDLHFYNRQPDTSLHCQDQAYTVRPWIMGAYTVETMDNGLVYCAV